MESEEKKAVKNDVKLYAALEAVGRSEGGKIIIKGTKDDILSAINELYEKAKSASDVELRATAIKLGERLALYRTLTNAPKNKSYSIKELDRLLVEDPDPVEEENEDV